MNHNGAANWAAPTAHPISRDLETRPQAAGTCTALIYPLRLISAVTPAPPPRLPRISPSIPSEQPDEKLLTHFISDSWRQLFSLGAVTTPEKPPQRL